MRLLMMYEGWHLFACYSPIQFASLFHNLKSACDVMRATKELNSRTDHSGNRKLIWAFSGKNWWDVWLAFLSATIICFNLWFDYESELPKRLVGRRWSLKINYKSRTLVNKRRSPIIASTFDDQFMTLTSPTLDLNSVLFCLTIDNVVPERHFQGLRVLLRSALKWKFRPWRCSPPKIALLSLWSVQYVISVHLKHIFSFSHRKVSKLVDYQFNNF